MFFYYFVIIYLCFYFKVFIFLLHAELLHSGDPWKWFDKSIVMKKSYKSHWLTVTEGCYSRNKQVRKTYWSGELGVYNIYGCTGQPPVHILPSSLYIYHTTISMGFYPFTWHLVTWWERTPHSRHSVAWYQGLQGPSRKKAVENEVLTQFVSLATYSLNVSERFLKNSNNNWATDSFRIYDELLGCVFLTVWR